MKHLKNRKTESTGAYHHPVLRFALFLLIAFLSFGTTFAQNSTIKVNGKVVDENGDVIIGANISVVGGTASTVTNIEGKFSIQVKENSLIRVSFIGYKAQNVRIDKNKKDIKVTLAEDTKKLEEVVVTALGISRDAKSLGYRHRYDDRSPGCKLAEHAVRKSIWRAIYFGRRTDIFNTCRYSWK